MGVSILMDPNFPASAAKHASNSTIEERIKYPYLSLVGSIMYIMISTCPDITYAISTLCQYSNCYTEYHWNAGIQLLQYLQKTKNYVLRYNGETDNKVLYGYSDSDCYDAYLLQSKSDAPRV